MKRKNNLKKLQDLSRYYYYFLRTINNLLIENRVKFLINY